MQPDQATLARAALYINNTCAWLEQYGHERKVSLWASVRPYDATSGVTRIYLGLKPPKFGSPYPHENVPKDLFFNGRGYSTNAEAETLEQAISLIDQAKARLDEMTAKK